jgi:hypothetical protein
MNERKALTMIPLRGEKEESTILWLMRKDREEREGRYQQRLF